MTIRYSISPSQHAWKHEVVCHGRNRRRVCPIWKSRSAQNSSTTMVYDEQSQKSVWVDQNLSSATDFCYFGLSLIYRHLWAISFYFRATRTTFREFGGPLHSGDNATIVSRLLDKETTAVADLWKPRLCKKLYRSSLFWVCADRCVAMTASVVIMTKRHVAEQAVIRTSSWTDSWFVSAVAVCDRVVRSTVSTASVARTLLLLVSAVTTTY